MKKHHSKDKDHKKVITTEARRGAQRKKQEKKSFLFFPLRASAYLCGEKLFLFTEALDTGRTGRPSRSRNRSITSFCLAVALLLLTRNGAFAETSPVRSSPDDVAFSPDGARLVVSDITARRVTCIDVASASIARHVSLRGRPFGIAWLAADRLLVSEYDAGTMAEVDVNSGAIRQRIGVGPRPRGIAVARTRNLAIVCDYARHEIQLVDVASGLVRARIPAGRHPRFAVVTPDDRTGIVAAELPVGPATSSSSAARLTLVDLETFAKIADLDLADGASNVRHVAVSPDGRWAYVAHTQGHVLSPTSQLDRGWVNTNALSIVDLENKRIHATALLDRVTEGAADPWGVALSPERGVAWVTLAGVHEVARVDLAHLHGLLSDARQPATDARTAFVSFPSGLYVGRAVKRISLPVRGPRGIDIAPDGSRIAVASTFSGRVLLLDGDTGKLARTITLGPQPPLDIVRKGEIIFHDGTLSYQHWLSCATCHPEGRADGLNWDLLNDGIGNAKNTRSLVLAHRTPPVMSRGVRDSYEIAVVKGFESILFTSPTDEQTEAVAAYIRSLEPEISPHRSREGKLSPEAQRGQRLFESTRVGCARCHPGPLFTDRTPVDVGTRGVMDQSGTFDVPTLRELWRTGPYLHDGSAATLKEILTERNATDRHGRTSSLSEADVAALVAYLRSL